MQGAFILGSSRCGSTMLSETLRGHPQVLSLSELLVTQGPRALLPGPVSGARFWRRMSRPTWLMTRLANPAVAPREFLYHRVPGGRFDPMRCPPIAAIALPHLTDDPDALFDRLADAVPRQPVQPMAAHYRAMFATLGGWLGREVWVERSGGSMIAAEALVAQFPEARFAVLLRDPRDVALSMQAYPPARLAVWLWARMRALGVDMLAPGTGLGARRRYAALEALTARALPVRRILATPPPLEDCAACLTAGLRTGLAAWRRVPAARRLALHYEAVCVAPRPALLGLAEWLGVDAPADWLGAAAAIPESRPPRWAGLPEPERQRLTALTEEARALTAAV